PLTRCILCVQNAYLAISLSAYSYHFWYKYQNWYTVNTKNGTEKIPEMVYKYQKWYMKKQKKYQKWYMDTRNGI
ncbi:hypothetical protein, partial [Anaerobutyricum hallii]|uniref:hypothetical protein n=1 Tax=Anaerobutyricum hallii TaxID=39488 RepID=UPI00399CA4C2